MFGFTLFSFSERRVERFPVKLFTLGNLLNFDSLATGVRRNDPWWMKDDEKDNPGLIEPYRPWWIYNVFVNSTWEISELENEARRRGLSALGQKEELIRRLNTSSMLHRLTDDNFRAPIFVPVSAKDINECYPDLYEGGEDKMQMLRNKAKFIVTANN